MAKLLLSLWLLSIVCSASTDSLKSNSLDFSDSEVLVGDEKQNSAFQSILATLNKFLSLAHRDQNRNDADGENHVMLYIERPQKEFTTFLRGTKPLDSSAPCHKASNQPAQTNHKSLSKSRVMENVKDELTDSSYGSYGYYSGSSYGSSYGYYDDYYSSSYSYGDYSYGYYDDDFSFDDDIWNYYSYGSYDYSSSSYSYPYSYSSSTTTSSESDTDSSYSSSTTSTSGESSSSSGDSVSGSGTNESESEATDSKGDSSDTGAADPVSGTDSASEVSEVSGVAEDFSSSSLTGLHHTHRADKKQQQRQQQQPSNVDPRPYTARRAPSHVEQQHQTIPQQVHMEPMRLKNEGAVSSVAAAAPVEVARPRKANLRSLE